MKSHSVAGTPANPTVKYAKLKIEGDEYRLAYDFNAIAQAEAIAGCNLLQGVRNLSSLSAEQLRGLLFAALSKAHPKITLLAAGEMVRLDTVRPITEALAEAYMLSLPEKKENPTEPAADGAPDDD